MKQLLASALAAALLHITPTVILVKRPDAVKQLLPGANQFLERDLHLSAPDAHRLHEALDWSPENGVLTGTPQVLRSFTVGPMWFYRTAQQGIFSNIEHTAFHLPQIAVRAALRVDYSTQPFFVNDQGGLERRNTRAVLEAFYLF